MKNLVSSSIATSAAILAGCSSTPQIIINDLTLDEIAIYDIPLDEIVTRTETEWDIERINHDSNKILFLIPSTHIYDDTIRDEVLLTRLADLGFISAVMHEGMSSHDAPAEVWDDFHLEPNFRLLYSGSIDLLTCEDAQIYYRLPERVVDFSVTKYIGHFAFLGAYISHELPPESLPEDLEKRWSIITASYQGIIAKYNVDGEDLIRRLNAFASFNYENYDTISDALYDEILYIRNAIFNTAINYSFQALGYDAIAFKVGAHHIPGLIESLPQFNILVAQQNDEISASEVENLEVFYIERRNMHPEDVYFARYGDREMYVPDSMTEIIQLTQTVLEFGRDLGLRLAQK